MGLGRKPIAAPSGSRDAVSFSSGRTTNRFRRDARQESREGPTIWIVDTHGKKLS